MAGRALPRLSGSVLKWIALAAMVADHVGYLVVFPLLEGLPGLYPLYLLLRMAGRISFPLFAFLLSEGCRNTRDFPRYLLRLLLFALAAQIPYTLAFGAWAGSVIVSFLIGAGAVFLYERLKERGAGRLSAVILLLAAAVLAELLRVDYGSLGVLLVFFLYLFHTSPGRRCVSVAAWALLAYAPVTLTDLGYFCCAALAVLPIWLYSGERGRGSKWFFYWFYPAHLLALWALGALLMR